MAQGKGEGITTAIAVAAFGAICVAGVLVALWATLRRPVDARVVRAVEQVDSRLAAIDAQIWAAEQRRGEPRDTLGDAIGSTLELEAVLQRALAATETLPAVDGSRISVRRADGTVTTAVRGSFVQGLESSLAGPPDGGPYISGVASWDVAGSDALRTGLVVPLGPEGSGSLAVFSRLESAFDSEAANILRAIARRTEPAVQNALRYLDVQELAATDSRTGLGSASAFEEALPREISAARRHGRPLCLIQIDLDDFGEINKRTGSLDAGNAVLAEFGERVRATIRGSDAAFRNSGGADEFFLILPETTRELAERLYARLRFEIATPPLGSVMPPVTMSSGLAELRADDTAESLRERAGARQTVAKHSGKDQLRTDADGLALPE